MCDESLEFRTPEKDGVDAGKHSGHIRGSYGHNSA